MLRDAHVVLAWTMVLSNAVAGLWALAVHLRPAWQTPWLWRYTLVAQLTVFAQVTVGVVLMNVEDLDPPQFHVLYGFSAPIAVGIIYSYRQQLDEHRYLLYGLGGLFVMGLGIRAMFLDGGL